MRKEVILLLLLVTLPIVLAQVPSFDLMKSDLENKTGLTLDDEDADNILVVVGENINIIEQGILSGMSQGFPAIENAERIDDTLGLLEIIAQTNKTVFFVGGPRQNEFSELLLPTLEEQDMREYGILIALYGKNDGRNIVIFSDSRGFSNLERKAADVSPLVNFIPRKYVPIAAVGISILLLVLLDFLSTLFENWISFLGTRNREIKSEFTGFYIGTFPVRWREVLSIAIASTLFALGLAWMFTAGGEGFRSVLAVGIIISFIVFVMQEGLRMFFAWRRGVTTEFVIYPLGIIVGAIGAFLGTMLAGPGTWLFNENDEPGSIYYGVMLTVFLISTACFVLNILFPSELMQLIMTTTSTVSFFEFLPISPINGKDVYVWSRKTWWITIIVLTPIYILINFFL